MMKKINVLMLLLVFFQAATSSAAQQLAQSWPDAKPLEGEQGGAGRMRLQQDEARPDIGRKPPPQAFADCRGKKAGDPVQHTTREGKTLAATCLDSPDGLVARPDQPDPQPRAEARSDQGRPDGADSRGGLRDKRLEDGQSQISAARDKQGGAARQNYSIEQAMSDNAQLSTIAFSGLAFMTGSSGADAFFPPGKVSDYFGFQYMRDVDTAGYGHNTTFLSRVANNVLHVLNDEQKAKLIALANKQAPTFIAFAYNRLPLMDAFRRNLTGKIPAGSKGLSVEAVSQYTANLYKFDASLSYDRALVLGEIIRSFTAEQRAYLAKMQFDNSSSWPDVPEDGNLKRGMAGNTEFILLMTYASELFSWYKGGIAGDIYFCPERHGTYFGGFFMKDYRAMNNPKYFISTSVTGDLGKAFLEALNSEQRKIITQIPDQQRPQLLEIRQIRTAVAKELRQAISGQTMDKDRVYTLIERYGELDGRISALYANSFAAVNKTLTQAQREAFVRLRNLDVVPRGTYRYSSPTTMPELPATDFLFAVGRMPQNAGQFAAPQSFAADGPR